MPKTWGKAKKKNAVFGIEPIMLSATLILEKDYKTPIPNVLIKMKKELFGNNGHLIEGIFRIAPNAEECKAIEDDLNNGNFANINFNLIDGDLIANLIKLWFRQLPNPILQALTDGKKLENACNDINKVEELIISDIPEPNKSYFVWLIDLCLDIIEHQSINKMNVKAMSVVMSPNLYDVKRIQNPMKAMTLSSSVVKFMTKAVEWRQNNLNKK